MSDRFLGSLKNIERMMEKEMFDYSAQTLQQLDDVAVSMIDEDMSDNDYMKVMELYARKYNKSGNKQGRTFCVLRIQQVLEARKKEKNQKQFPRLEFTKTLDAKTKEFVKGFRNYIQYYRNTYKSNLLKLDVGLTIAIMVFTVLVLQIPFFVGWGASMVFFVGLFWVGYAYGFPKVMDDQIDTLIQFTDPYCESIDKSVRKDL